MTLHFKTFGDPSNPVVVLLHGLFGMSDNLASLAKSLADHHFVWVFDLINHGRSPHRSLMDYPVMAKDVLDVLHSESVREFSVVGHSMGGKVAMQLAELAPDNIQKLIIADIAPVAYEHSHNIILEQMQVVAGKDLTQRRAVDGILAEKVHEPSLRQFLMKNMHRDEAGFWRWTLGLQEIAEAYPNLIAAPALTRPFEKPTLFIKGERSDYIVAAYEAEIRRFYPYATLKVVQGTGHWLHAEKPLVFNRLVARYLVE